MAYSLVRLTPRVTVTVAAFLGKARWMSLVPVHLESVLTSALQESLGLSENLLHRSPVVVLPWLMH